MKDDFRPARPSKPIPKPKPTVEAEVSPSDEPAFRTPEEIAASEENNMPPPAAPHDFTIPPMDNKRRRLNFSWPPSRKQLLIAGTVVLLLAAGFSAWWFTRPTKPPVSAAPKVAVKPKPKPVPTTVPSALSGLPVDPSANKQPVTGVMIENSTEARPQSGLSQAGVVFEAIAEGGITRFLALFQDQLPDNVGPVRSVRPYYLQWDLGFDAPVAHVGGSPEALQDVKDWQVKDLDQFYNGSYYQRITSREAPHNVYTSLGSLNTLETNKGYTTSVFTGFLRKGDSPAKQPTASSVDFAISSSLYNVHYDYDKTANSYKRSEGGSAHVDANTNNQLEPKVVIAIVIPYNLEADNKHSQYGTVGNGQAYIFQDGDVTIGTWSKIGSSAQITFSDAKGQPVKLNAGQTWISAVSSTSQVSYK